jgi:hypothetical protein
MNIFWTCLESMASILGDPPDAGAIEQLQCELREMTKEDRAVVAEQFNILAGGISRLTTIDTVVSTDEVGGNRPQSLG